MYVYCIIIIIIIIQLLSLYHIVFTPFKSREKIHSFFSTTAPSIQHVGCQRQDTEDWLSLAPLLTQKGFHGSFFWQARLPGERETTSLMGFLRDQLREEEGFRRLSWKLFANL